MAPFKLPLKSKDRHEAEAALASKAEKAAHEKGIPVHVAYECLADAERDGITFEEALKRAIERQKMRDLFGVNS
jgi:hypothetical protein